MFFARSISTREIEEAVITKTASAIYLKVLPAPITAGSTAYNIPSQRLLILSLESLQSIHKRSWVMYRTEKKVSP